MTKELEIAIKAAKEAGEILLQAFGKAKEIRFKGDRSVVTEFDNRSEEIIIRVIKNNFPTHQILAEEAGLSEIKSDYLWMIDPLDGTTNFSLGIPIFSISIALLFKKEITLGVTYNPFTKELFQTEKGNGAFLNNQRILVSDTSRVNDSVFCFSRGRLKEDIGGLAEAFDRISRIIRTPRVLASSTYQFALVASGRSSGLVSLGCTYWDVAAGVLLVQEAGGKVTDLQGDPWSLESKDILATNGRIHQEILEIINR